ncbi:MAG: hypothetical protein GC153_06570 [Alphaproteobacteria bacterium]|nr:hypothetical protein [Alphaproteobacteria bacterium]
MSERAHRRGAERRLFWRVLTQASRKAAHGFRRFGLALKRRGAGRTAPGRAIVDLLLLPSDVIQIADQHCAFFGRFPNFVRQQTFTEWLNVSKVTRRKPHYVKFADKLAMREFARARVGDDVLTQLYWSGVDLLDAKSAHLPNKFALKANHACGTNLFVEDAASFDWAKARALTQEWLDKDHSALFAEWQYRWIPRRLFIEEFLEDAEGKIPVDYKFFCFHGRIKIIEVDLGRFANHVRAFVDRDFNRLPLECKYPQAPGEVPKPDHFKEMREIAETLSAGEPFVRVDLYDVGRPVISELTLHPAAGLTHFKPAEWDRRLYRYLFE